LEERPNFLDIIDRSVLIRNGNARHGRTRKAMEHGLREEQHLIIRLEQSLSS
jgi:hypothetical protein